MTPDYTKIEEFVKSKLKPSRFIHSEGVMEMSQLLASRFGVDEEKAKIAAIYHDAYRYDSTPESIDIVEKGGYEVWPEERKDPVLLHGALAAVNFDRDAGCAVSSDMKDAVRHHTLGHVSMVRLGGIIYISDYAEKGRKHLSEDERRAILNKDSLESMIIYILERSRDYLLSKGMEEAGVSKSLYNYLKEGGRL